MSTIVVVGAQWGDEGKGKVVDVLAERADVVARFAGGNNAGHTLVIGDTRIVTHLVPSGCAYKGTSCVLGAGMVIDLDVFREEVASLQALGLLQDGELRVSLRAHVIFDFHRALDGLREDRARAQDNQIGTTRRGVGPTYEAKAGRRGIRVRDLFDSAQLRERLIQCKTVVDPEFERLGHTHRLDVDGLVDMAAAWASWLEPMVGDVGEECHAAIAAGKNVLFEGAQGAMLDVDHGTYPFVTSSNAIAGGVCTGIGIGPTLIDEVWGITKAYTTRVGAGPFPTRIEGPHGEALRQAGNEYGATTGRPRDCGWLDLPALRYSARINGMSGLCVTKLDVLADLPQLAVCTEYRDGRTPGRDDMARAEPVLERIEPWGADIAVKLRAARTQADIPSPVRAYLDFIAEAVGVPVVLASVGPDRAQTIMMSHPFR